MRLFCRRKESQRLILNVLAALDDGQWITGPTLAHLSGTTERMIRDTAEVTGKIISGQLGYKLASRATRREIEHAMADLRSRERKIQRRADILEMVLTMRDACQQHSLPFEAMEEDQSYIGDEQGGGG